MKVADLLETRRQNWQQLEQLCVHMETRRRRVMGAAEYSEKASVLPARSLRRWASTGDSPSAGITAS